MSTASGSGEDRKSYGYGSGLYFRHSSHRVTEVVRPLEGMEITGAGPGTSSSNSTVPFALLGED
ncbi:MAG TPA: hypothetical protein VN178_01950 [Rubrobacter sp.]|nr:hypothetical protein [Rubrobacter sp.]